MTKIILLLIIGFLILFSNDIISFSAMFGNSPITGIILLINFKKEKPNKNTQNPKCGLGER